MALTQERLKERLSYNPETGIFTWVVGNGKGVKANDIAGGLTAKGYVQIWLDGTNHLAHRLAWLYMYGGYPTNIIDHRNRIKDSNDILNLYDVTHQQNQRNRKAGINNKSGVLGVHWCKKLKKWVANIKVNGKSKNLGSFISLTVAARVRRKAEIKYGFIIGG